MIWLCKLLDISVLKNTIVFFAKDVRVFLKSRKCFSRNTYDFLPNHSIENKSIHRNIR